MKVPPKPADEADRLKALHRYNVLDTLPEPAFDDIAFLASQICQTPIALVSFVDEKKQWFKARKGLAATETPREIAFCAHAILESEVFVVSDASRDERFHDNPLVLGEPSVSFYAGAPLKTPEGFQIGTLCVMDHKSRQLTPEQIQSLEALSRQVIHQLESRIKSETILRAAKLFQYCPAAIYCKDYDSGQGIFVEWNDAAEGLWNLNKNEVVGRMDSEIFPADFAERNRKSDEETLLTGQQVYIKQESVETAQGRKELRTWKVPVFDVAGKPRFVLCMSLDITHQIVSEKKLQDARIKAEKAAQDLEFALEGASLGIWDWDLRTNQVNFDRRWCEMLGLNWEHTPMELKTWEELVHPEDLPLCYKDIQAYLRGETEQYENVHRMRHADGEWLHILDRGRFSAWDKDGKPIRFTGTHLDISYIEKSKKELQNARRSLEEAEIAGRFGSWKIDLLTGESTWSRGHNHIFGVEADLAHPSFEKFISILDPQEHNRLQAIYQDMLSGKISSFETDYRIIPKSGPPRYVRANGEVNFDSNHRPVSIIGTVHDITNLKLMEFSLIESREMAIAAAKTKSRFLANMSHEIRTPLNGVVGSTVLLMETSLSSEQRELAETIKSSSDSLLALIDDILDFSKIEAGKLDIEMLPFDLRATVRDALKIVSHRAAEKEIALLADVNEDVPTVIVSDPLRFRQVLLNLLSNAVKFTDLGQVRVRVSHTMVSDLKLELVVVIEDSGIGMSQEQLQKLFQDFSQADGSTTRKYGGTGLGLAISKQLCSLLGGSIEVTSEPGKGSTFKFRIMAEKGQALAPASKGEVSEAGTLDPAVLGRLRVLIAEDNKTNQLIASQLLKKVYINADLVDDGQAAFEAILRENYDLVFMDVHMPHLDGYDATREIRRALPKERQPYVLALTANAMKEDREKCIAAGMDGFLTKPLDLRDLTSALHKFLHVRNNPNKYGQHVVFQSKTVLARFMNDWDLFQHSALQFLRECQDSLMSIQQALNQQDAVSLRKKLHTLKGAASYFSGDVVTVLAGEMEDLAGHEKVEETRVLYPRLKSEVEELSQAISSFLDKRESA